MLLRLCNGHFFIHILWHVTLPRFLSTNFKHLTSCNLFRITTLVKYYNPAFVIKCPHFLNSRLSERILETDFSKIQFLLFYFLKVYYHTLCISDIDYSFLMIANTFYGRMVLMILLLKKNVKFYYYNCLKSKKTHIANDDFTHAAIFRGPAAPLNMM